MDVWQLIGRDHANIEHLIHDAPRALNGPGVVRSRERLLDHLVDALEAHAQAVSVGLYAPLGRLPQTRRLVDELSDGHRAFIGQLSDLARRRRKTSEGWLNDFEDATYLVDQHLHRLKHELLPAARTLLSDRQADDAARAFVQARRWALQARHPEPAPRSELDLKVIVCTLAVGVGYLLWQSGFLGGSSRKRAKGRPAADGPVRRRERMLDEGLEDTFPASDPISAQRFT
ncbi:hemerythrin domain-containing protein [Methylobacterium sp. WL120]|uniref:hemerythrin domain-containing protein n=1 Tax=Methylobacterium sp. WL120 TaxID=2603887 RepID=UPI0011CA089D|nr:hemerythrin domain-containing protein [Methylobacterium sp. WL120]TXM67157.1 hemerythrin domain-containing protein [Methylobacterium sp. WL120]